MAQPFAYVSLVDDSTVVAIDTATDTVAESIPVAQLGSAFAVHPSGRWVYVTAADGAAEIDASANSLTRVIHAGVKPSSVAVSPDGQRLYITDNAQTGATVAVDLASGHVDGLPAGSFPFAIALSPEGDRAYVTNTSIKEEHAPCSQHPLADCPPLSVLNLTHTPVSAGQLNVGIYPTGVAVDSASGAIYVAVQAADAATESLYAGLAAVDPHTLGVSQIRLTNASPRGVAVQPLGHLVYVSQSSFVADSGISVVDPTLSAEIGFIPVGRGDVDGVAFNSSGSQAYVVDVTGSRLVVVDTASRAVATAIALPGTPRAFGQFVGRDLGPSPTPTTPSDTPTATLTPTVTRTPTDTLNDCCFHHTCPELCGDTPTPASTTPTLTTPTPATCFGDCDGNGLVTVSDLVNLVNLALGNSSGSPCGLGAHEVTIGDLIRAVNVAVNDGCNG
ncbi:MAG: YncE family protein [bacterium]